MPRQPLKRDIPALIAFIDGRQSVPHAIGRTANDCVAFAFGAVEAQTGVRPAAKVAWSSPAGARRALARFESLEAGLDAFFDRVPVAQAKRGDIAGVPDPELGIHPMIVEGATLVGPGELGNRRLKRSAMTIAWSSVTARRSSKGPQSPVARPSKPAGARNV